MHDVTVIARDHDTRGSRADTDHREVERAKHAFLSDSEPLVLEAAKPEAAEGLEAGFGDGGVLHLNLSENAATHSHLRSPLGFRWLPKELRRRLRHLPDAR